MRMSKTTPEEVLESCLIEMRSLNNALLAEHQKNG
jgi:hypothetical protein